MKQESRKGFIALISAIIISALLIVITFTLGLSGYYARFNTLNIELKKQSVALAEGCADTELAKLAAGNIFTAPYPVTIGSNTCTVYSVSSSVPVSGETTVKTKATYQEIVTNLSIVVDDATTTVLTWQEIPNLP